MLSEDRSCGSRTTKRSSARSIFLFSTCADMRTVAYGGPHTRQSCYTVCTSCVKYIAFFMHDCQRTMLGGDSVFRLEECSRPHGLWTTDSHIDWKRVTWSANLSYPHPAHHNHLYMRRRVRDTSQPVRRLCLIPQRGFRALASSSRCLVETCGSPAQRSLYDGRVGRHSTRSRARPTCQGASPGLPGSTFPRSKWVGRRYNWKNGMNRSRHLAKR